MRTSSGNAMVEEETTGSSGRCISCGVVRTLSKTTCAGESVGMLFVFRLQKRTILVLHI